MKKTLLGLVAVTFLLGACEFGPKQTIGAGLGGIGGGVIGSTIGKGSGRTAAIIAGTLIGGLIGSEVGASMDRTDRMLAARTTQSALETAKTNTAVAWSNPDNGNSGTIVPTRTFQQSGQYCREYQQTVIVGGQKQSAYGTACRQPDGSWQVVS